MIARKACLVTGGSGFVGKALAIKLIESGYKVVTVSRRDVPELRALGATVLRLDLEVEIEQLAGQLKEVSVVFHTAAKVGMWGRYNDFVRANVDVTKKLLELARTAGVKSFVYTSSPSVVASGTDLCGVDESQPYPEHYEAFYPQTKAMAEQLVLAAHDTDRFRTLALRPHLIFGPGDTNLIPAIINKAKAGRLVRVGAGSNLVDITFIDDCVQAHLDAFRSLTEKPEVGGKAYFISQAEPVELWAWIDEVLKCFDLPPVKRSVPTWLAKLLAAFAEKWARLKGSEAEPALTKFLVSEMSTSHYFDISAAKQQLGFSPRYSVAEALELTRAAHQ